MSIENKLEILHESINEKRKVLIEFNCKKYGQVRKRICAPLDFGNLNRSRNNKKYYFFWDFTGSERQHPIPIEPNNLISMEKLPDNFNPSDFIDWDTNISKWNIPRDWGKYS